jgi:ERCC4-type nuclease
VRSLPDSEKWIFGARELIVTGDTREPKDVRGGELIAAARQVGIPYRIHPLPWGDFQVYDHVWERKTIGDLYEKWNKNEMPYQLNGLVEFCVEYNLVPALFVHGSIEKYIEMRQKVTRNYLERSDILNIISEIKLRYPLISILTFFGTDNHPDIPPKNTLLYALESIMYMAQEAEKLSRQIKYETPPRYNKLKDPQLLFLARGLKIPIDVAERLLVAFVTVQGMLQATDDQLITIQGVHLKTLAKINKLRGL